MAIHFESKKLFEEAIDEYLAIAEYCLRSRKPDTAGGAYGYVATLLLFCVVDAMTRNLVEEEKATLRYKDRDFAVLTHPSFGLKLRDKQLCNLGKYYRHQLAHKGLIAEGTVIRPWDGPEPFEFIGDKPNAIYLPQFYALVEGAWGELRKQNSFTPRGVPRVEAIAAELMAAAMNSPFQGGTSAQSVPPSGWVGRSSAKARK
jgi:hypothetical protein